MKNKGQSFSVIPIIALLGVLGLSIWAAYQLSLGNTQRDIFQDVSEEDEASQKLELIKNMLISDLTFSSSQASLEIAANGGTETTTFWYCTYPLPPTPEEVQAAMSKRTLDHLNSYVRTLRDENILFEVEGTLPLYSCARVFDKGKSKCLGSGSSQCEDWAASAGADGAKIEIKKPASMSDSADLEAHIIDNRFYWMYYNLYENFQINDYSKYFPERITTGGCNCYLIDDNGEIVTKDKYINDLWEYLKSIGCVDDSRNPVLPPPLSDCPDKIAEVQTKINNIVCVYGTLNPGYVKPDIERGLREICDLYRGIFDSYVECSWKINCFQNLGGSCINSQCTRGPSTVCTNAPVVHLSDPARIDIACDPNTQTCSGSARFTVTLTDNKFLIPSKERDFQKLVWNINGFIEWKFTGCPILVFVPAGGSTIPGGSQNPPQPRY